MKVTWTAHIWRTLAATTIATLLLATSAQADAPLLGDMNCDGEVNAYDIDPFIFCIGNGGCGHAGPVAWYPFDGNARDYGGSAIHGTVVGEVTYEPPVCDENEAACFYTGHIEAPHHDNLDLTGDFTIEMWLYLTGTEGYKLVGKHKHGTNDDGSWILEVGNGFLRWNALPPGPDVVFDSDPDVVPFDQWAHIVITYDESSDLYTFYVNGDPAGSGVAGLVDVIQNTERPLWISEIEGTPDPRPLAGCLDELRIWDQCRTEAQIQESMAASCHHVLLVCSLESNQILRYNACSGELLGVFAQLNYPRAVALGLDGYVYVSTCDPDTPDSIWRYDSCTGEPVDEFASILQPIDLTFGPDGALYILNYYDPPMVYRCVGDGICEEFTSGGSLDAPVGLTFGPDGNLYVTSSTENNVQRFDGQDGHFIDVFASEGLQHPNGLAFGPEGYLYVCSGQSNEVLRFDGTTGEPIDPPWPTCPELDGPPNLRFGPDGKLYVTSQNNDSVVVFDVSIGECETFIPSGDLHGPRGLGFVRN